jgi:5,10-methylenetetrahydromethanopterin reductase
MPGIPRTGVWLFPEVPSADLLDAFSAAESHGLDEVWLGDEGPAHRDPFAVLAAAAVRTERILLGVAVTNPYLRHPAVTASAMMTVQELSGGRAVLGFGPGGGIALDPVGVERVKPLSRTREAVRIARAVTAGRSADGYHPSPDPFTTPDLPVFVGARGERFNRYASAHADGAFLGGIPFPLLETAFGWVRSVRAIPVAFYPSVVLDQEDLEWARPSYIVPFLDAPASTRQLVGLSEDEVRRAVLALQQGDEGPARSIVTDQLLAQLAVVGTPAQIGSQLAGLARRYRPASIGVCIRSSRPLASRIPEIEEVFAAMSRELCG